jgi:hypothetical protein
MSRSALPFLAASMVVSSGIIIFRHPSYRTADVPDGRLDGTGVEKVGGRLARVGVKSAQ